MRRSFVVLAIVLVLAMSSVLAGTTANGGKDPWKRVKAATARYNSLAQAQKAGYTVEGEPCVASPEGAMGIHAINPTLMADPAIHPLRPEILLYVPDAHGKLRLVGLEYWKTDDDGDLETDDDRPFVLSQALEGPMPGHNPTMPVHYDLHVWLFEANPSGFFAPFNPNLSCPPE
jgi:hypothetical protein